MTLVNLLEQLKAVTDDAVKDLLLPVRAQKGDTVTVDRPATVYKMRLPDHPSDRHQQGHAAVRATGSGERRRALHLLRVLQ